MDVWNDIRNYEGYYQVSSHGQVRSLNRVITRRDGVTQLRLGKMCRISLDKDGYEVVKLSKDGISRYIPVHRLVYQAFCGDIPPEHEINHIDFDRRNNSVDNLEAVTHTENIAHTVSARRNYTAKNDISGKKNPNYGNRTLSNRYRSNPELSKKQSRPGSANGRSKPISVTFKNGEKLNFAYIGECADYLISNGISQISKNSLCINLSRCAQHKTNYLGMSVEFI